MKRRSSCFSVVESVAKVLIKPDSLRSAYELLEYVYLLFSPCFKFKNRHHIHLTEIAPPPQLRGEQVLSNKRGNAAALTSTVAIWVEVLYVN